MDDQEIVLICQKERDAIQTVPRENGNDIPFLDMEVSDEVGGQFLDAGTEACICTVDIPRNTVNDRRRVTGSVVQIVVDLGYRYRCVRGIQVE